MDHLKTALKDQEGTRRVNGEAKEAAKKQQIIHSSRLDNFLYSRSRRIGSKEAGFRESFTVSQHVPPPFPSCYKECKTNLLLKDKTTSTTSVCGSLRQSSLPKDLSPTPAQPRVLCYLDLTTQRWIPANGMLPISIP